MIIDPLNQEPGYVYGIKSLDLIKVGVARDIQKRMNGMRLDNPHELTLVFQRRSRAPYTLERQMHRLLADKAVGREWFRATLEDVRVAAYTARLETLRIETGYRQKFRLAVAKNEKKVLTASISITPIKQNQQVTAECAPHIGEYADYAIVGK